MAGLKDSPVAAVLRAESLPRARDFYSKVLGLTPKSRDDTLTDEVTFEAGSGTMLSVYERPGMPAPQNTTLAFGVAKDRFDATVAELRGAGVKFEDYDMPDIGLVTHDGVAEMNGEKMAWFLDTEGNILSIGTM